jgi:hypothetical protein
VDIGKEIEIIEANPETIDVPEETPTPVREKEPELVPA